MKLNLFFYILLGSLILNSNFSFSQENDKYPQDYFRSPIEGRIYLSGTFGELRSNHFHAGIDIKTGGSEGKNIYAAADGWVSRVKISPWGYGHAVYIEHPNGYTTVYGHLQRLKGDIADYVKKQQYKKKSFSVDLYLTAHQFEVKKGDIIALSGNSGGSGGPHLHFEIRETANQEPINPILFGIQVKDFITPQIKSIRIYPAEKDALVNGKPKAENFVLKGWGKDYRFKNGDSIKIHGDFYLGIATTDKQNDSHNKNGVYEIELYADSNLFYHHKVERLNFSTSRYINTLIDYKYYKNKKRRYQRTYQTKNNKLGIYQQVKNEGILSFNDNEYHHLKYIIKDIEGNESVLQFTILSMPVDSVLKASETNPFNPSIENKFSDEQLEVIFPANCLYDTLSFTEIKRSKHKNAFSPIFHIGEKDVALQKHIKVKISGIITPDSVSSKLFLGKLDDNNNPSYTSKWTSGNTSFRTKSFGNFGVFLDSIPPSIKLKSKKENIRKYKRLTFIVKDLGSGINDYTASLNEEWILLKYDPKKLKLYYEIDQELLEKNTLIIEVSDQLQNKTTKTISF